MENFNDSTANGTSVRLTDLCYVYAKSKWMRTFKAFDLDGFFPGKLIYASLLENSEDNKQRLQHLVDGNKGADWQFQLRAPNNTVVFETRLS